MEDTISTGKNDLGIPMRELEKISGFNRTTINFYIKEGLLPTPKKSAKNMSYYDGRFVRRLKEIKILKDDGHFSLKDIKKFFDEQNADQSAMQMRYVKCLNSMLHYGKEDNPVTMEQLKKETGISESALKLLIDMKLITASGNDKNTFPAYTMTICSLAQYFISLGIPIKIANSVVEKLNEIVNIECEAFSTYIYAYMREKNYSLNDKMCVIEDSFQTINSLLPILHMQIFKSRIKKPETY